jgi:hypothetical protein
MSECRPKEQNFYSFLFAIKLDKWVVSPHKFLISTCYNKLHLQFISSIWFKNKINIDTTVEVRIIKVFDTRGAMISVNKCRDLEEQLNIGIANYVVVDTFSLRVPMHKRERFNKTTLISDMYGSINPMNKFSINLYSQINDSTCENEHYIFCPMVVLEDNNMQFKYNQLNPIIVNPINLN